MTPGALLYNIASLTGLDAALLQDFTKSTYRPNTYTDTNASSLHTSFSADDDLLQVNDASNSLTSSSNRRRSLPAPISGGDNLDHLDYYAVGGDLGVTSNSSGFKHGSVGKSPMMIGFITPEKNGNRMGHNADTHIAMHSTASRLRGGVSSIQTRKYDWQSEDYGLVTKDYVS